MNQRSLLQTKTLCSELLSCTQLYLLQQGNLAKPLAVSRSVYLNLKSDKKLVTVDLSPPALPQKKATTSKTAFLEEKQKNRPEVICKNETLLKPEQSSVHDVVEQKEKAPVIKNDSPSLSTTPKKEVNGFLLEPLPKLAIQPDPFYLNFFSKNFPSYSLKKEPLPDGPALQVTHQSNQEQFHPVVILSFEEQGAPLAFLQQIARAITLRFSPVSLLCSAQLEKENRWLELTKSPQLRLVMACDTSFYLHKTLVSHYHQPALHHHHYLGKTPLLLLSDLSFYLKRPELKSFLWNAICNTLK